MFTLIRQDMCENIYKVIIHVIDIFCLENHGRKLATLRHGHRINVCLPPTRAPYLCLPPSDAGIVFMFASLLQGHRIYVCTASWQGTYWLRQQTPNRWQHGTGPLWPADNHNTALVNMI